MLRAHLQVRLEDEAGKLHFEDGAPKLVMKGWNKDQKQRAKQQKPRLERIGAVRQKLIYHVGEEVDLGAVIGEMGSTLHALTGIQNGKLSHTDSKAQTAIGWHWSSGRSGWA